MTKPMQSTAPVKTGFNLFAYYHEDSIYALGAARHDEEHEELNEEEMIEFLKSEVPHDALKACRQGFKTAEFTTELSDGTVAIPGAMFEELRGSGKDINLFDGLFTQLEAPEDFVLCFTRVKKGIPMNESSPIYFEDSQEMDQTFRESIFLLMNNQALRQMALTQSREHGRGAIVAMADPCPSDPQHREVRFLAQTECILTEPVWENARGLINDYDPKAEMVVVFLGPNRDNAYRFPII